MDQEVIGVRAIVRSPYNVMRTINVLIIDSRLAADVRLVPQGPLLKQCVVKPVTPHGGRKALFNVPTTYVGTKTVIRFFCLNGDQQSLAKHVIAQRC